MGLLNLELRQSRLTYTLKWPPPGMIVTIVGIIIIIRFKGELIIIIFGTAINLLMWTSHHHDHHQVNTVSKTDLHGQHGQHRSDPGGRACLVYT